MLDTASADTPQGEAALWGDLGTLPLVGVLELLDGKSGVLLLDGELPLRVEFASGHPVSAAILDWEGLDALYAFPVGGDAGSFRFLADPVLGTPLAPSPAYQADWARRADEWPRVNLRLSSPGAELRGAYAGLDFGAGTTVRSLAAARGQPLFELAQQAAEGVGLGALTHSGRSSWERLRVRAQWQGHRDLGLDGERTVTELLADGVSRKRLRAALAAEIQGGLRFSGCGAVLRDLTWEDECGAPPGA